MTKEQVIALLDHEVGLAIVERDENEEGELYITEAQLKEAEHVLTEIIELRWKLIDHQNELIKKIKDVGTQRKCFYQELENGNVIDKVIDIRYGFESPAGLPHIEARSPLIFNRPAI